MRYVLDGRSVFEGMGGIGVSTAGLARGLAGLLPEGDELVVLSGSRRPREPIAPSPSVREVPTDAAMLDPVFEQVALPALLAELEADLYHGTCFAVPLAAPCPRVSTVHDVVFRAHPDLVEPGLRRYLDRWTAVSCDVAEAVVTVSQFSRREIARLYGRREGAIDVVQNAVDERFFDATPAPPCLRRQALPPLRRSARAEEERPGAPRRLRGAGAA